MAKSRFNGLLSSTVIILRWWLRRGEFFCSVLHGHAAFLCPGSPARFEWLSLGKPFVLEHASHHVAPSHISQLLLICIFRKMN